MIHFHKTGDKDWYCGQISTPTNFATGVQEIVTCEKCKELLQADTHGKPKVDEVLPPDVPAVPVTG
jgi:hypothetical protein